MEIDVSEQAPILDAAYQKMKDEFDAAQRQANAEQALTAAATAVCEYVDECVAKGQMPDMRRLGGLLECWRDELRRK